MSSLARLSLPLLTLSVLVLSGAAGWWWITYSDVIGYNYISVSEASTCLVGDSEICILARSLCRGAHPVAVAAYRAATFWAGLGALSASLAAFGFRKAETSTTEASRP